MPRSISRFTALLLLTLVYIGLSAETKPLTNDDVVQMVKAGFDDETIVKAIKAHETNFDTSVQALVGLKTGGVSKPVIDAMLESEKKTHDPSPNPASVGSAALLADPPKVAPDQRSQKVIDPAIYVEEVSSSGGVVASSDSALEAIKTLQDKHVRVVTIKERADYVLQITRQLGKKSWKKDTKVVLSNKGGDVVMATSTRTVGGAIGDIADYIHKHHE